MSTITTPKKAKIAYMDMTERMQNRRKELGYTQAVLAKKVGVSRVSVTQWESGDTSPRGENLYTLCKKLECSPDWLLYGKEPKKEASGIGNTRPGPKLYDRVPLISWVQAGEWTEIVESWDPQEVKEWHYPTIKVGPNSFALRVHGDSMTNHGGPLSIPEGSIVVVDPDVEAVNGKIVIARLEGTAEATIKKLVIDGTNEYLKPLHPEYKMIPINGNCVVIGVVRQVIQGVINL